MLQTLKTIGSIGIIVTSIVLVYSIVGEYIHYTRCDRYRYAPATEVPQDCAEYLTEDL